MAKAKRADNVMLSPLLVESVKTKRAVLFLGAGASKEARDSNGRSPPDGDQLRDILAQRFFDRPMKNRSLMTVAEMAITSSGGASQVFETAKRAFDGFQPSEAHKLISSFNWRMIATTNYDLLVERGYADSDKRLQTLVRFVKDDEPVEEKLQAVTNPVQYLKLHGCLDHIYDNDIPLILSREQYAAYSLNRTRLFNRLHELARESTIIFVGYRLDDAHILDLIYKLGSQRRPRWFMVSPDAEDVDVNFWATKNIEVVKCRFGEFMSALDISIPPLFRFLAPSDAVTELPIRKFFITSTEESLLLRNYIRRDVSHIYSDMAFDEQIPKQFYEGYDTGWGAIVGRLDVHRKVEENLLYKIVLESENPPGPLLIMLRGTAGSGKTIALKRTAYEAATTSNALVLWHEESGALHIDALLELYDLCKRTIYLFVDQVALHVEKLHSLLKAAQTHRIPLVVVGAERDSDWNTYCDALESEFVPQVLRVGNLSRDEVEGLLDLLERYNCLGLLRDMGREEQIDAFMEKERADRQLLVALHELTQGRPFEEIVLSEHQRVHPELARQLYLDIATMHQFSVKVRAGTISRISGIDFNDYRSRFFAPLEDIVRVEQDAYTGDFCYRTRHARIALLVFRQVCADDETKARQFKRLIEGLDVGYSSDQRALEEMTRGRALAESFAGAREGRTIYEAAVSTAPKKAFLYQQWAIFESTHAQGSLLSAERLAAQAHELDPRNNSIKHTQAEIYRKQAFDELSLIKKDSLRRAARVKLNEMPSNDRFSVSSRCKLLVDEVDELSVQVTEESKSHEVIFFSEKVKETESALQRAQQQFTDDADIIQVEARFWRILHQGRRALSALERAWSAGPRGAGTAIRIAKIYDGQGRTCDASKVLREALVRNPDDKAVHLAIALHQLGQSEFDPLVVEDHLRKSFSSEDQNFEERFTLAQFLFFIGKVQDAVRMFAFIDQRAPASFRRTAPRGDSVITSRIPRLIGSVEALKERFLFIRSGSYPQRIFCHHSSIASEVLEELSIGKEVNFRVRFNREGPTAVDVQMGRITAH